MEGSPTALALVARGVLAGTATLRLAGARAAEVGALDVVEDLGAVAMVSPWNSHGVDGSDDFLYCVRLYTIIQE
jgi:hypothetical protein